MSAANRLRLDAAHHEPSPVDHEHPAGGGMLTVTVGGSRIFCTLYLPQGEGPHPVMLMLHGLPGTVRGEDIAQTLRRAGMAAVIFSYRGSWGSEGVWSYRHAYEDAMAVYNRLRDPAVAARYRIDPERVAVLGHSLGGLMAMLVARDGGAKDVILMSPADPGKQWAATHQSPEAMAKRMKRLAMLFEPLHGAEPEKVWNELGSEIDEFDVLGSVPRLREDHRFLFIGAEFDTVLPLAEYCDPLVDALERRLPGRVTTCVLPTGHNYNNCRLDLARVILNWLHDMGY